MFSMSWLFGKEEPNEEDVVKTLDTQIGNIDKRMNKLKKELLSVVETKREKRKSKNENIVLLMEEQKDLIKQEMRKLRGMKVFLCKQKALIQGLFNL